MKDEILYEKLASDPTKDLHKTLLDLWVEGKSKSFVSAYTAKNIMGISDNESSKGTGPTNCQSTLPHFKPGKPYFYPCLKIHKMKKDDLQPGVEPPIRLITALQEGVTRRSDVYLADNYLKSLERDFCEDMLIDNNDALSWLEDTNNSLNDDQKSHLKSFSFDFKALYDSLDPKLALEALQSAMDECRPDWSTDFKTWILDLIGHSFKSSVGQFEGDWYRQKKGVPTGGSLCVQIANIAVYYILRKAVYSDTDLMSRVATVKRYIDDGGGFYDGTKRQFSDFIRNVNDKLSIYGLTIDEHSIAEHNSYTPLLDIQFCFDKNGKLQTDLYVKETDSRAYLYFGSTHPNHVYSSIVYSQCLRLRRIINDNERLSAKIDELKICFFNSNYPKKMVENISSKVKLLDRVISNPRDAPKNSDVPQSPKKLHAISTFGSDSNLINVVEKYEPILAKSASFTTTPPNTMADNNLIKFVKRTGASLRKKLVKGRQLALCPKLTTTSPCNHRNCQCCNMINSENFSVNNINIKPAPGTCCTYNIIYVLICRHCGKPYVGRTIQELHCRIREHRNNFYKFLANPNLRKSLNLNGDDDVYSLGIHLFDEHNLTNKFDFNKSFKVSILMNCSPSTLDVNEHRFIQKLKSIKPFGINSNDPFSIPLLNL